MDTTVDPFIDWYNAPLDIEDIVAGGSFIILILIFVPLYLLVVAVFVSAEKVSMLTLLTHFLSPYMK